MASQTQEDELPRLRRILRLNAVMALTGRRRTAILTDVAAGVFPAPIPLGKRSIGWLADEIARWVEQRVAKRDAERAAGISRAPPHLKPALAEARRRRRQGGAKASSRSRNTARGVRR